MKLVILESPNKTKTVRQYLQDDVYRVISCNGHVKKLAKSGKFNLGVDLETFEPRFIVDRSKKEIIKNIIKNSEKVKEIYLATDPDREGEAISYHLSKFFPNHQIYRVFFNEITKKAVQNAFLHPTKINDLLVESQITRRILDRILGFRLSFFLQREIDAKSAGRVQSVALKIIVEREQEIKNFVSEKTWELFAQFENQEIATFKGKIFPKKEKIIISSIQKLKDIETNLAQKYLITKIDQKERKVKEILPLKTSTLLSLAAQNFGFTSKKTMFIAQKLYEGIEYRKKMYSFISYPRTDSTRINEQFAIEAKKFITQKFGAKYVKSNVSKPIKKQTLKIQDAHEAIRITDFDKDEEMVKKILKKDFLNLYDLIYRYTLASFIESPKIISKKIILKNNDYYFNLGLEKLLFDGFYLLFPLQKKDFVNDKIFSDWKLNQTKLALQKYTKEKITKPKPRFNDGSLIKKMESLGVGRPSTYAQITSRLIESDYLERIKNILKPTPKGEKVKRLLNNYFHELINEKYTAILENSLDEIAGGKLLRFDFLKNFWKFFSAKIKEAELKMNDLNNVDVQKCPQCTKKLLYRKGKFGSFLACSAYPECKYVYKEKKKIEKLDRLCPQCEQILVKREGRYGDFVSCSGFPKCNFIERKKDPSQFIDEKCPDCQEQLLKKKGRFGDFIACSGFPKCRYIQKKNSQNQKKTKKLK